MLRRFLIATVLAVLMVVGFAGVAAAQDGTAGPEAGVMFDFVPFIVLAGMNKKILDYVRVLIPDNIEAKVLIPLAWVVGIGLAFLFSTSDALANEIVIWSDHTLGSADPVLVAVYGFGFASAGGIIHDAVKPHTPPHDGT